MPCTAKRLVTTYLTALLHDPSTQLTIFLPRLRNVAVAMHAAIIQEFLESMFPANGRCRHFPIKAKGLQLLNTKLRQSRSRLGSACRKLAGCLELRFSVVFALHLDPFAKRSGLRHIAMTMFRFCAQVQPESEIPKTKRNKQDFALYKLTKCRKLFVLSFPARVGIKLLQIPDESNRIQHFQTFLRQI